MRWREDGDAPERCPWDPIAVALRPAQRTTVAGVIGQDEPFDPARDYLGESVATATDEQVEWIQYDRRRCGYVSHE